MRVLCTIGLRALLPRSLRVFARSNWTGAGVALDDVGLAASIHGLLLHAYQKLYQGAALTDKAVRGDAGAGGGGEGDVEDWLEVTVKEGAGAVGKDDEDVKSLWKEENIITFHHVVVNEAGYDSRWRALRGAHASPPDRRHGAGAADSDRYRVGEGTTRQASTR